MTDREPDITEQETPGAAPAAAPAAPEDVTVIPVAGGHEAAVHGGYDVVVGRGLLARLPIPQVGVVRLDRERKADVGQRVLVPAVERGVVRQLPQPLQRRP